MQPLNYRSLAAVRILGSLGSLLMAGLSGIQPGYGLPEFSRRYNVGCATCHTIAPRLNTFGLGFQANHFNWPGGKEPSFNNWLKAIPVSALVTASSVDSLSRNQVSTDFRSLELFASGGFSLGRRRQGGYFLDNFAVQQGGPGGDFADAFISLPIAGARGQYALTIGQFTPMMYQYDAVNSLTRAMSVALSDAVDAFSLTDANPGVRLDFFDHRGEGTADGCYASLGVPIVGHLTATQDPGLQGTRGVFAHAFRRSGYTTLGVFGFTHAGSHLEGVMGTYQMHQNLFLTGIGNLGHDRQGSSRHLSFEAEYVPGPQLALTGRLEAIGGHGNGAVYPVAALTYYPFHQSLVRLMAQTIQKQGSRTFAFFIFGQV